MTVRNHHLLAAALAMALSSPAVLAGKGAPGTAAQSVQGNTQNTPERTLRDLSKPVTQTTETTERIQGATMPPPQSQGAEHAAGHSSVVQRELWGRLDANSDGRISAAESAADSGFKSSFAAMDADGDGFVSDTEFRTTAKADQQVRTMGDAEAAAHSAAGARDAITRLDANADGSVSLSEGEADASFKASFAAMDRDSDGLVSDAEYRAWAKAERK